MIYNEFDYDNYNSKIVLKVNQKIKKMHITQKELSLSTGISQSTLSKLLANKSKFTVEQLLKISIALQTDISEFASFENGTRNSVENMYSSLVENDNLVCDTKRTAYKGYLNNEYSIYFYPTISSEDKLIHGKLRIYDTDENRCKINFKLYTGKIDIAGEKITKNYTGDMIISIPLSSCYCILINQSIGEMCFLIFHHMFLFNHDMMCRVGAALTTSSGENRRPTLHRMIISKYDFDMQDDSPDLHFLKGQLKLNDSKIIISKTALEDLKRYALKNNLEEFQTFFSSFETLSLPDEYYVIDENKLLDSTISISTKVQCISLLREKSISNKYNKISTKSDEYLFKYLEYKNPEQN